jgi:hypothetical protein
MWVVMVAALTGAGAPHAQTPTSTHRARARSRIRTAFPLRTALVRQTASSRDSLLTHTEGAGTCRPPAEPL